MNEAETRAEHIDPALKAAGWGVVEGSRIHREFPKRRAVFDPGGITEISRWLSVLATPPVHGAMSGSILEGSQTAR